MNHPEVRSTRARSVVPMLPPVSNSARSARPAAMLIPRTTCSRPQPGQRLASAVPRTAAPTGPRVIRASFPDPGCRQAGACCVTGPRIPSVKIKPAWLASSGRRLKTPGCPARPQYPGTPPPPTTLVSCFFGSRALTAISGSPAPRAARPWPLTREPERPAARIYAPGQRAHSGMSAREGSHGSPVR